MKAFLSLLATALVLATTASADWVIESKIENGGPASSTSMAKLKGDKLRMDMPDGPLGATTMIVNNTTGDTIQILHAQKIVMKATAAQLKAIMDSMKGPDGAKDGAAPALKATGQKEKVGGYDCDIYTWTSGGTTTRFWITKDHPQVATLRMLEKQMRATSPGAVQLGPDTSALPGASIKMEVITPGQTMTSTIISVKEQPVDAKEFEVPAGYQTMDLPALLQGK